MGNSYFGFFGKLFSQCVSSFRNGGRDFQVVAGLLVVIVFSGASSAVAQFVRTNGGGNQGAVGYGYGYGFGQGFGIDDGSQRTSGGSADQYLFGFGFGPLDTVGPSSTFGGPPNGQQNVPVDAMVDISFNETLSPTSVNTANVLLQANTGNTQGGTPSGANLCVSAVYENNGTRIRCEHMSDGQPLSPDTWYSFTVTTGVTDFAGNVLTAQYRTSFKTANFGGGGQFTPPPIVTGSVPNPGTTMASNSKIKVYFNPGGNTPGVDTMATSGTGSVFSLSNVKVFAAQNGQPANQTNLLACAAVGSNPASPTDCNIAWDATLNQLVITPGKKAPVGTQASTGGTALTAGNKYILIIEGMSSGGGVKNTDDTALPMTYMMPFEVTAADTVGPDVTGSSPQNGATDEDRMRNDIYLGLSESIDGSTVSTSTVKLYRDDGDTIFSTSSDTYVTTTIAIYDSRERAIRLVPNAVLAANTKYFVQVIASGITDEAGNNFDGNSGTAGNQDEVIAFTTGANINGAASDTTKPRLNFANADNFSVAITLSEPVKFNVANSLARTSSNGANDVNNLSNWTLESPENVVVSLTGKSVEYQPQNLTLVISGLTFPPSQQFKVTASSSIQDLSGNGIDTTGSPARNVAFGTVQNVNNTGGQLGPGSGPSGGQFDFFSMGVEPVRVFPRTAMAGATSNYEVEFPADTAIPSGGQIVLTFPSGFSFAGSCSTAPTSVENNDINGPSAGAITIASIACDSSARTVTITTGGGATVAGDRVRLLLQAIVNSTVPKDFNSSGYSVDLKTKNTSGTVLDSKTSMPFFLTTPGSQSVSGTVYNDVDGDNTLDGGESGVSGVKVCMGGMMGFSCTTTDSNGAYSFGQLNNGFYNINIPPLSSGSFTGGPFFRDVNLTGGASQSNVNFALRASDRSISVSISGIPSNTDLDVFAFSPFSQTGGNIVREVLWNGNSSRSVSLPVTDGAWEVGLGPWMPKDPSLGPPPVPDFNFMPPKPQQVKVSGSGTYTASFAIQSANRTVIGKVVDGGGNAIPNAFVLARPAKFEAGVGGGGVAQSKNDGSFSLRVVNGVYLVDAGIPGMPPSIPMEVTVYDDTGNSATDNNSGADVYSEGVLIKNDNDGGTDNLLLKIAKGDKSISGRVIDESGNPIAYAHVGAEKVDSNGNPIGAWMDSPTDSSGNYTLYVSQGSWKIRAFAPGYGEVGEITATVTDSSLSGQNLQASSGNFGTVSGQVTKGGSAVAGAFVGIHGSSGGNHSITDASGNFSMKVRAGNNYTLDGFVPGVGPLAPLTSLTITAGQTLASQNLSIGNPGTIRVTITGIADAFVEAFDSNGRGNGTGANPTPGVYDINVPAGTYNVRANNPKYGVIGSTTSAVTAGNTTNVTFAPPTLYTVSGLVSSVAATCVNGANVFMADQSNGRFVTIPTSATGTYAIQVPSGTYRLMAGKPGCVDSSGPGSLTVSGANVSSGTNRTLAATNATISGQVTLSGTNVTFETKVFAETSDGKFMMTDVNTSATSTTNYTLNLTAGTWVVTARSDGYQSASTSVTVAANQTVTQNLILSAILGYTRVERGSMTLKPSQGGIVRDTNIGTGFEVNIPAGALGSGSDDGSVSTKQTTSIVTQTPTARVVGGKAIEITPKNASGQPITTLSSSDGSGVTISIPYSESDVTAAGGDESKLVAAVWSDEKGQWEALPTTVDTANNTLTTITTHFSTFAPIVPIGGGATTTVPSTPSGLAATTVSASRIDLSWTQVSGTTGYDIYRSTSANGTFSRLGSEPTVSSGTVTTYSDTGLTADTLYFYKISAVNGSAESAASAAVSAPTNSPSSGSTGSSGGSVSGGGGGGGGGYGGTPAPWPTSTQQTSTQPVAQTTSLPTAMVTSPSLVPFYAFSSRLALGSEGEAVKKLQEMLAQDPDVYPNGLVTGYYGPMTEQAVQRFQEKHGIASEGDAGYGTVGPSTRAKLNSMTAKAQAVTSASSMSTEQQAVLRSQIAVLQQQLLKLLQQLMQMLQQKSVTSSQQ